MTSPSSPQPICGSMIVTIMDQYRFVSWHLRRKFPPPPRHLLLAGLAILSILAGATGAQAAMLTVCNKTGEKIRDLFLEEAKLRSAALIANGSCVSWSDVARGSYYIRYILGENSRSLLCALALEFNNTKTVEISPTTTGNCIK
jgi:hypothetical protein